MEGKCNGIINGFLIRLKVVYKKGDVLNSNHTKTKQITIFKLKNGNS